MKRRVAALVALLLAVVTLAPTRAAAAGEALTVTFTADCKQLTVASSGYANPPNAFMWLRWKETAAGTTVQKEEFLPINATTVRRFDAAGVTYSGYSIRPVDADHKVVNSFQDRAVSCVLQPVLEVATTCTAIDWSITSFGNSLKVTVETSIDGVRVASWTGLGSKTAPVTGHYDVPLDERGKPYQVRTFYTDYPTAAGGIRTSSGTLPRCEVAAVAPTQKAVCGPDNDSITVPDQSEAVESTVSAWAGSTRTVTYALKPAYQTGYALQGQSTWTFTDAAAPCPIVMGATVWLDGNRNGLRDTDEVGLPDATVRLLDANGKVFATAVTDAVGAYSFTVAQGVYTVEIDPLAGYVLTTNNSINGSSVLGFGLALPLPPSPTVTPSPSVTPSGSAQPLGTAPSATASPSGTSTASAQPLAAAPSATTLPAAAVVPTVSTTPTMPTTPAAASAPVGRLPETGAAPGLREMVVSVLSLLVGAALLGGARTKRC